MPMYKNISWSDLYLPREDGLKPDLRLLPDRTFNGSTHFYEKYVTEKLISRTTDGFAGVSAVTTGPDVLTVSLEGFIEPNGLIATSADAVINSQVVAGTAYSAFGKIEWDDGTGTTFTIWYSVIGNGTHGGTATFSLSAASPVGPAQVPQVAGSIIDCPAGTIAFSITAAGMIYPSVGVIYNPIKQGWRARYFLNPLLEGPCFSVIQTTTADNQVTYKKEFLSGSEVGDPAKITRYSYTGARTVPDTIMEQLGTVTAADLTAL